MLFGYVLTTYFFLKKYNKSLLDLGFRPQSNNKFAWIGGILIYVLIGIVFVTHKIFYSSWQNQPILALTANFLMVAVMAGITDFWTRGFILLQLTKKFNAKVGILGQNFIWFLIHIYEIDLLTGYVSLFMAIGMTLFLGILGDIITLKYRDIRGLMVGHAILNLMILITANIN